MQCATRERVKNRTRFTVVRYQIDYPGEVATPTANMLVAKILFYSVISKKWARFMTIDISNFYITTPLKQPEYIRIHVRDIPDEIIIEYKLKKKTDAKGVVYIITNRGMYGLPHSGLISNEILANYLTNAANEKAN